MGMIGVIDRLGDANTKALAGLMIGVVFGVAVQRSKFCLPASAVEFARGTIGPRTSVWLLAFATAPFWTQFAIYFEFINLDEARILAISGAIIGGLLFGIGMVMARGYSGRLLVLAATGNMRAVISGLVFAVVAQMSLHGWLSPLRDSLALLWITPNGRNINLLEALGLPGSFGIAAAVVFALTAWVALTFFWLGAKLADSWFDNTTFRHTPAQSTA